MAVLPVAAIAQRPWRFILTCDSRGQNNGIQKTILSELVSEIIRQDVDLVLFPGDLVSGHSARDSAEFEAQLRTWVDIMAPVYDVDVAVYVGRGNHETADTWGAYAPAEIDPNDNYLTRWLNVFGSDLDPVRKLPGNGPEGEQFMTYSVAHENALIVMLDQYDGSGHKAVHRVNQQWLDAQLAGNVKPHVFVAGHEAAFRAMHVDCLDNEPSQRDALWACIRKAGGRTYLCGHDHFYDHARVDDGDGDSNNDIHQFMVGTAGAPPYKWSPPYSGNNGGYNVEQLHHAERYGYILAEIEGLAATLTWMERHTNDLDVTGSYEPNDTWSYTVEPKLTVLSPNNTENLVAASEYTITWKTIEGTGTDRVRIDFSSDGGQSWHEICSCPNTGWYIWDPVPEIDSDQCLIRISDMDNTAVSDISDGAFTVFVCRKQLYADLNGDCYVDFLDFIVMATDWLNCGNPFDTNCD